jgi:hypothetical protein
VLRTVRDEERATPTYDEPTFPPMPAAMIEGDSAASGAVAS